MHLPFAGGAVVDLLSTGSDNFVSLVQGGWVEYWQDGKRRWVTACPGRGARLFETGGAIVVLSDEHGLLDPPAPVGRAILRSLDANNGEILDGRHSPATFDEGGGATSAIGVTQCADGRLLEVWSGYQLTTGKLPEFFAYGAPLNPNLTIGEEVVLGLPDLRPLVDNAPTFQLASRSGGVVTVHHIDPNGAASHEETRWPSLREFPQYYPSICLFIGDGSPSTVSFCAGRLGVSPPHFVRRSWPNGAVLWAQPANEVSAMVALPECNFIVAAYTAGGLAMVDIASGDTLGFPLHVDGVDAGPVTALAATGRRSVVVGTLDGRLLSVQMPDSIRRVDHGTIPSVGGNDPTF